MYKVVVINIGMFDTNLSEKIEEAINNSAPEGCELVSMNVNGVYVYTVWKKKK